MKQEYRINISTEKLREINNGLNLNATDDTLDIVLNQIGCYVAQQDITMWSAYVDGTDELLELAKFVWGYEFLIPVESESSGSCNHIKQRKPFISANRADDSSDVIILIYDNEDEYLHAKITLDAVITD